MKWRVLVKYTVKDGAKRYCSQGGNELRWETEGAAKLYASHMNETTLSKNLTYIAEPINEKSGTLG